MAKLNKQYYYTANGEKKVNCYHVIIPKEIVTKTNITEDDKLKVYENDNKIIIEKSK